MTIRELGQRLYAALDSQDWSQLKTLVATDVVIQVGSSPPISFRQWQHNQEMFHAAFPDGHHVIDSYLQDGEHLITRCRFVGTHTGPFGQTPPSGAKISVGVIHIDRFRDYTLVEHHGQLDMLGLLQQINTT